MRARSGTVSHKKHKRIKKQTKGMTHSRRRSYRLGKQAVIRAAQYAYRDRRNRKRDFRKLWIIRLNAAVREHGMSYSQFVHAASVSGVTLNRKVLSEIASQEPDAFAQVVQAVKPKK